MSQSSSDDTLPSRWRQHRTWIFLAALPLWVLISFYIAQAGVVSLVALLKLVGVNLSAMNDNIVNASLAVVLYTLTLAIVIGIPYIVKRRKASLQLLGLTRRLSWLDIGMTPVGLVVYFIATSVLAFLATTFVPGFDISQAQDTGFTQLSLRYEYIVAFLTLVVLAPIAEEVLFRGYLFGKLRQHVPIWLAIIVTSLVFGFIHGAWNLAIDTFALSVVLCVLRVTTGSLWAPILLHMTKNGIAFYLLFINPLILTTLGG
jgi:membrane protease YdiL (CAAX protease family)